MEKEERELEGEERGTRKERELEIGARSPCFYFSHRHGHARVQRATLEGGMN